MFYTAEEISWRAIYSKRREQTKNFASASSALVAFLRDYIYNGACDRAAGFAQNT